MINKKNMRGIWRRLRLFWSLIIKGGGYYNFFVANLYKIYLNHNKIIHYRDGYPVYSLSTPALFSKPSANFFTRALYRVIQNRNMPNLMSFAVNDVCNARCEHCSFYRGVDDKNKKVLTLEQAKDVIRQAQELGVSIINFVGGEPLLRPDFLEILSSVDKDLSTTILFTNGSHLTKKARELKIAGLDGVYVSIDSADADKHDTIRQRRGTFSQAMQGIKAAKAAGLSVGLSACLTPESYADGEFGRIVELGKNIGAHEVLVFDAIPTGKIKERNDLIDNFDWVEEMIKESERYNQDNEYPGVIIYSYMTSHRSVGCAGGTSYLYVSPYGEIMPCDFNHTSFGSITKEPLYKIWHRLTSHSDYQQSSWGGCKVKNSEFRSKSSVATETSNYFDCKSCEEKSGDV